MLAARLIDQFTKAFEAPLPGVVAQYKMAHVHRQKAYPVADDAVDAAVLALFYPLNNDWHLALIQRTSNNNDRHSGQISFPGGRKDQEDTSLMHTAVREVEEEIGVKQDDITVVGELTSLYIPVSNYNVSAFVGVLPYTPAFVPQLSEVQSILSPKVKDLLSLDGQQTEIQINKQIKLKNVPYYPVEGKVVWGATAMIMSELLTISKNVFEF